MAQNEDVVKKRQLMYEEMLSRQVKQMQLKEGSQEGNQQPASGAAGRRQLPQVPQPSRTSQVQNNHRPTSAPAVRHKSDVPTHGAPPKGSGPPPYDVVIKQRPAQAAIPLNDPNLHRNVTDRRGQYEEMTPFPGSQIQQAQAALLQHMVKSTSSVSEKIQAQQRAQLEAAQHRPSVPHTQETPGESTWLQIVSS